MVRWLIIVSLFKSFLYLDNIEYEITLDGRINHCFGAIITNGKYYVGKYICAPDGNIEDNKLHAIIFKMRGAIRAFGTYLSLLLNRIDKRKDVKIIVAKEIYISAGQAAPIQVDGDYFGDLPVNIKISSDTLSIIVP